MGCANAALANPSSVVARMCAGHAGARPIESRMTAERRDDGVFFERTTAV